MKWYYFYTPEYEEWHEHLQSRLESTFATVPICLDKIDIHDQHRYHHFTGSTTKVKLVIDAIKNNLGDKIVFSDVTWVIDKNKVHELKEIMEQCTETTYAQNSWQTDRVNIGLICLVCTEEELKFWEETLHLIEQNNELHDQTVVDNRLKKKVMFDPNKVVAELITNKSQFEDYVTLKLFTPSAYNHKDRYNYRMNTIKNFFIDF